MGRGTGMAIGYLLGGRRARETGSQAKQIEEQAKGNVELQKTRMMLDALGFSGGNQPTQPTGQPISGQAPIGQQGSGARVKGASIGGLQIEVPETKREKAEKLKETLLEKELTKAAERLPDLDSAVDAYTELRNLWMESAESFNVPGSDFIPNMVAKARTGITRSANAASGANPEFRQYLANRKAFSSLISKGGFREAGVLTNQDINRIIDIFPGATSTDREVEVAFREIDDILSEARKRYERKLRQLTGENEFNEELSNKVLKSNRVGRFTVEEEK